MNFTAGLSGAGWVFGVAWLARMLPTKLAIEPPARLGASELPRAWPVMELTAWSTERPALVEARRSATGLAAEATEPTIVSTAAVSASEDGLAGGFETTAVSDADETGGLGAGDFFSVRAAMYVEAELAALVAPLITTLRTIGLLSRVMIVAPLPTLIFFAMASSVPVCPFTNRPPGLERRLEPVS